MRKILLSPADLKSWVVVDFAGCDPSILNMFISDLAQAMGERGQFSVHYYDLADSNFLSFRHE